MDLWNWKNNINTSRTRLESAKIHSTNYIINTGATYEEDKFWMNAFQDYNSGKKYWIWDEDEGWQKNKSRPNEYGKTIYVIYQSFNNKFGVMK